VGAPFTVLVYLRLCRPHQWTKNAFVAAALFFTPAAMTLANAGRVALGIVAFSLLASATYIVNDLVDRAADRQHPTKRTRPLASGTARVDVALGLALVLLAGGAALGLWLGPPFLWWLAGYLVLTLAYSLVLKRLSIVDVMAIAIGFVLRLEAGAALIAAAPSVWILLCTFLLALFLAIAKRRDDIVGLLDTTHRASLAGYSKAFLDIAMAVVLAALMVFYALYTTDAAVMQRLGSDQLYLSVPIVLAGCLRYLQMTLVEERSGAPTELFWRDPFLLLSVAAWALLMALLIYG
jgi:decaprenyl-phosphate phosphoribosyltransferase